MTDGPVVSIIVPVYNAERHIGRCLDSIKRQSLKDFECIIVDDGSSDSSSSIVDGFAAEDSRFRVLHVSNGGVSKARNIGLDHAEGEFIGFVDSDDFIEPDMFESLVSSAESTSADMVQCLYDVFDGDGFHPYEKSCKTGKTYGREGAIEALITEDIGYVVWNKVFRSRLVSGVRFNEDLVFAEDLLFNVDTLLISEKNVLINKVLYHYYEHDGSLTRAPINDRQIKGLSVYGIIESRIDDAKAIRVVSEKKVSESFRFMESSIGHSEVSSESKQMLRKNVLDERGCIPGNRFMDRKTRIRAIFFCVFPGIYTFAVKTIKKLR